MPSCRVMLQCCPLAPHAAKPTYWVRYQGFFFFFGLFCTLFNLIVCFFVFFNYAGHSIMQNLPTAIQTICDTWNSIHTNEFPNIGSWVCTSVAYAHFEFVQLKCITLRGAGNPSSILPHILSYFFQK